MKRLHADDEIWTRLEHALRRHAPDEFAALAPPATAKQISAVEQRIGLRLPTDVRSAYLWHNGTPGHAMWPNAHGFLFPPMCKWCPLDQLVESWEDSARDADLDDREIELFQSKSEVLKAMAVRPASCHRKWIPIGLSNTATRTYVDMAPGPMGTVGQLILHNGVDAGMVIAPSLNAWIDFLTRSLESGRFVVVGSDWQDTENKFWRYSPAAADPSDTPGGGGPVLH